MTQKHGTAGGDRCREPSAHRTLSALSKRGTPFGVPSVTQLRHGLELYEVIGVNQR